MSGSGDFTYEQVRRVEYGGATFIPVCPTCRRFVRADESMPANGDGEVKLDPNAICRQCGRVCMIFEGYL